VTGAMDRHSDRHRRFVYGLMGTSALVAAGLVGVPAGAADKLQITVGGYYMSAFGFISQTHGPGSHHPVGVNQDDEIHFTGETTLDNGLTVGVHVELEGGTTRDQIDERYVYLRGGYGELRYGDADDARIQMAYLAPEPTKVFGVNTPYISFNNATTGRGYAATTNTTIPGENDDAAKLIYFTPNFSGFQLAISYAPDGSQDQPSFGTRPNNDNACGNSYSGFCNGSVSNDVSVGASYSGEVDGITLGMGGGATWGFIESRPGGLDHNQTKDPSYYAFGLNAGFSGFTVGGSLAYVNHWNLTSDRALVFDAGATYNLDAVTVGIDWSRGIYERKHNPADLNGGPGSDAALDDVQLGASYAIGSGISVDTFIGYLRSKPGGNSEGAQTTKGIQGGVGTALIF
jgi:outer membrane protein OmpU